MKIKPILFITALALAVLACQTLAPQAGPTAIPAQPQNVTTLLSESDVPRIGVHEAKAALDSGAAILVDVRSADSYAAGHAEGAVSIPLLNFENNIESLSLKKEQWIITYCT